MGVAATLVQGNQQVFNMCDNGLAKKSYGGNVLDCLRAERRKIGMDKSDLDSTINVSENIITSWSNADGTVTNSFGHQSNGKIFLIVLSFLTICYLYNK